MPSKRFDQAKPFATLGLALLAWLVIPVAVKAFIRASFFEFQAPLALTASHVRDLQEYWQLRMHTNDELVEAGRDQGRLIASYETTVHDNVRQQAEIDRYQRLLNVPAPAGFRAEVARVALRDFSAWWQVMQVQKGRNYGITVDAPVIFAGGLVGKVTEVHARDCVVELISSPTFRLAASFEGDERIVSFRGGINPSFGPAQGAIEGVPIDIYATAAVPKQLMTSGLGGVFPPGLSIGQVTHIEKSGDGQFAEGEVQLDPRLSSLAEVTILVPQVQP